MSDKGHVQNDSVGDDSNEPHALETRVIYCGDNLQELRRVPDSAVDLIYADPPINSDVSYESSWVTTGQETAIRDSALTMARYVEFMRERCVELRRVLTDKGSIYLHTDRHSSHYLKLMLDEVFGSGHFRNEIIW